MKTKLTALALTAWLGLAATAGRADPLAVDLAPAPGDPAAPQMGDQLSFHSVIRNDGQTPAQGLIAWLSLVRIDQGHEQPVDLEDWSAQKAVTARALAPGATVETDWPMRLIQAGTYRVIVSAVSRDSTGLAASPFDDFVVRPKPVVESRRVLPVALGLPLLLAGTMVARRWWR